MGFWVYIHQSKSSGRFYCGQTADLQVRLSQHNDPDNNLSKTTKRFAGPWKLVWSQKVDSGSESVKLERRIKKRGIGRFLQDNAGG
jgi:putative endonuclease